MEKLNLENINGENHNLDSKTVAELMDHLTLNHHEYMKVELPRVTKLSYTIRRVHGNTHPELHEVENTFKSIAEQIEQYIEEDEHLFTLIKGVEKLKLGDNLQVVEVVANNLKNRQIMIRDGFEKLKCQTNNNIAPDDGCQTFDLTYELYTQIEGVLNNQFEIENKYLFTKLI